jgi:hypothetical protein
MVAPLHRREGLRREVPDLERLVVVHARLSRDRPARERDAHDHRLIPVRVADAEVRAAVDADDPLRHDLERGLLTDLPDERVRGLLAGLDAATREAPLAVVAPALQQHPAGRIDDDRGDARHQQEIRADLGPEVMDVAGDGQAGYLRRVA